MEAVELGHVAEYIIWGKFHNEVLSIKHEDVMIVTDDTCSFVPI